MIPLRTRRTTMAQEETPAQSLTRRLYALQKLPDFEWDFSWIPEEKVAKYVSGYELAREVVRQVLGDDACRDDEQQEQANCPGDPPACLGETHVMPLSRVRLLAAL